MTDGKLSDSSKNMNSEESGEKELTGSELKDVAGGVTKVVDVSSPKLQEGVSTVVHPWSH